MGFLIRHRGFSLLFTLIALGVAIGSRPAHGQTVSFLQPLSGSADIAADASGVYAVGLKGLAKYDSRGNQLWTRSFGAGEQVRGCSDAIRRVRELHVWGPEHYFAGYDGD